MSYAEHFYWKTWQKDNLKRFSNEMWFLLSIVWLKNFDSSNEAFMPFDAVYLPCKVVQSFMSADEILKCDHLNESFWAVLSCGGVLFTTLYKVVLTFESVDEILKCDHSNKSYWAVLSCGAVYYAVQGGSNFWVCGWNPTVWPFTLLWYCSVVDPLFSNVFGIDSWHSCTRLN